MEMPRAGAEHQRLAAFVGGQGRYTHTVDEDSYSFRLEVSQDGETWSPMMEGTYVRA